MGLEIASPTFQCSHKVRPFSNLQPPSCSISHLSYPTKQTRSESHALFPCPIYPSHVHISTQRVKFKKSNGGNTLKRCCIANIDGFFEEMMLELSDEDDGDDEVNAEYRNIGNICTIKEHRNASNFKILKPKMLGIRPEPPEWPEREAVRRTLFMKKASSLDIPLSLRMIKKKKQRQKVVRDLLAESSPALGPLSKALSSMVFIILELQSYALQKSEVVPSEEWEVISAKRKGELGSSFLWLFQTLFSPTPALMINLMILLANFSVYSVTNNVDISDPSSSLYATVPQSMQLRSPLEVSLWNCLVDEARKMNVQQYGLEEAIFDHQTMQSFVSPVSVEVEPEDYTRYFMTDLMYQKGLSQEPNNPLLLSNYAEFLYLVAHDYERAEECFKRAVEAEPQDGVAQSRYAIFLWKVKGDLWEAEERYLQSMAAEPECMYYVSEYAVFLWRTGGAETCFPLAFPQDNS